MNKLTTAIITFFVGVLAVILTAFTSMMLFNWFITPIIGGFTLTMIHALGIRLLTMFYTNDILSAREKPFQDEEKNTRELYKAFLACIYPLSALLAGYVIHYFM